MKRLLTCLPLCAAASVAVFAQGTKKMNSIKRSSQYLYAEATMDTAEDAYSVAKDLLLLQVKEYADSKKAFKDKDILIRNISQQQDSLQIRRGDMVKVFLYVKKSDIVDVDNVTLVDNAPAQEPVQAEAKPEDKIDVVSMPAKETVKAPHEKASAPKALKLDIPWQQNVIDSLLEAQSFTQAKALLNRYKAEYKIKKTGPLSTCKDVAGSYLLVGKDDKVVTVLGPGQTDLSKYNGTVIVWFTFAK